MDISNSNPNGGGRTPFPLSDGNGPFDLLQALMHAKSVVVQSPHVGVVWKFAEGCVLKSLPFFLDHGSKLRSPMPVALKLP
ncbi:hypothetical protein TNCV_3607261 [Trichonephila clavipes]|nr:hypothetical protein TNCV_3607261 [Trichonephila clavipes]